MTLVLTGAAAAQGYTSAGVTGNLFDRYELAGNVTNLNLSSARGNTSGEVSVAGQKYLGTVDASTNLFGTVRVGTTLFASPFNHYDVAAGPFVEGELLAKGRNTAFYATLRHTRPAYDLSDYSNLLKVGFRYGELVK